MLIREGMHLYKKGDQQGYQTFPDALENSFTCSSLISQCYCKNDYEIAYLDNF